MSNAELSLNLSLQEAGLLEAAQSKAAEAGTTVLGLLRGLLQPTVSGDTKDRNVTTPNTPVGEVTMEQVWDHLMAEPPDVFREHMGRNLAEMTRRGIPDFTSEEMRDICRD